MEEIQFFLDCRQKNPQQPSLQSDKQEQTSVLSLFVQKVHTGRTRRCSPQMAADLQSQSHIFRAKVVSNCSQAAQVCQNANE